MFNPIALLHGCLVGVLAGLWAFMWTGPLSQDGPLGWFKGLVYKYGGFLYKPLIGCAKCHAFWLATLVVFRRHDCGLYVGLEIIILAVFVAYQLEKHD